MKKLFLFIFLSLFIVGCSGTFNHQLEINPAEPIRVAVLPFVQVDENGEIVEVEKDLLVDNVALVSKKLKDNPPEIFRKIVQSELSKTSLDVISPYLVDFEIPHHGYLTPSGEIDLPKLYSAPPNAICKHFLDCDAVFYGKVTRWDRSYYGLQSTNRVGFNLRLVSAKDNSVLFESNGEDSEGRGILKGPTGYSSLVVEPIKGLDSELIVELSEQTVAKMLAPLRVSNRPEFLNTPAPSIYATSHDGGSIELSVSNPLSVLMFAEPGNIASFSIGEYAIGIPMEERSGGRYYGEYYPLETDSFSELPVHVSLKDKFGRVAKRVIGEGPVSLNK